VDVALDWCAKGLLALNAALAGGVSPATDTALAHHFRSTTPDLTVIRDRLRLIESRIANIPVDFTWIAGLRFAAQTQIGAMPWRTEIGDLFSTIHGPNGRAAVLIHEAAHFVIAINTLDVPEWSGETPGPAYHTITPAQAVENPSSYAAFAQEIAFGRDTRFGEARLHQ
jgi:hypothetical protein